MNIIFWSLLRDSQPEVDEEPVKVIKNLNSDVHLHNTSTVNTEWETDRNPRKSEVRSQKTCFDSETWCFAHRGFDLELGFWSFNVFLGYLEAQVNNLPLFPAVPRTTWAFCRETSGQG